MLKIIISIILFWFGWLYDCVYAIIIIIFELAKIIFIGLPMEIWKALNLAAAWLVGPGRIATVIAVVVAVLLIIYFFGDRK